MYPDYQYEVRKFDDIIYTDTRISNGNYKLDTTAFLISRLMRTKIIRKTLHILTTLIPVPLSGLL